MGYFKSVSYHKRKKKRLLVIFIIVAGSIYFLKFIVSKINIDENLFTFMQYSYLGLMPQYEDKKEQPVFNETNSPPLVYLYNTHQTEKYRYEKLESYNIDYTVMFASYIMQSYLEKYNIASIVETESISKLLQKNNLSYSQSYEASRILLENAYKMYPSLKLFIDIHRDAAHYDVTTCSDGTSSFAKIMFVVGLEHENYEKNLELAEKLNSKIIELNPCLSRGVITKSGSGVDGIYNQDFHENVVLIELGGQYNFIKEANNTLEVLSKVISEYILGEI